MFSQLKLAIQLILGFIQFLKLGINQLAIYHCSVKAHARSQESANHAVRSAAYRAGTKLVDELSGNIFNYSYKSEVTYSEIMVPANAPDWASNRTLLWNNVEKSEKRVDARLFREVEVALPHELTDEQNQELLREYSKIFTKDGMIVDFSIHGLNHNPHCHMMLTLRDIVNGEFGKKNREWNDSAKVELWRKAWATLVNMHLAKAGFNITVDHRSYEKQGLDVIPTVHEGREGIGGHNKEKVTARRQRNRTVREHNKNRSELKSFQKQAEQIQEDIEIVDEELAELKKSEPIIVPPIERNYSLAPTDLLNKTHEILINSRPSPEQSVSVRKTISALPAHCIDLRLPNGKIIYPENKEALKQAIDAWSLNPKEAERLEAKFWSLATDEYYNHGIRSILNKNASAIDPNILDCFTKLELNHYKSKGVSPKSVIQYALQRKEYEGPPKEVKVSHRGVQKSVESCKDFYVILKHESLNEQIELNKQYWKSVNLKSYCLEVFDAGMSFGFKPENFDPLNIIKNHKLSFNPKDYAEAIYQRTTKRTIDTPVVIRKILTGTSSIKDYDKIFKYGLDRNLTTGDFNVLLEPWWSQISYSDYYDESRRLFIENGRFQDFDRLTYEQIEDSYYNKVAPIDFANSIKPGTGTGTGGYEPEEDFRPATVYERANHSYDTPKTPRPPGYGGSSTPKPW